MKHRQRRPFEALGQLALDETQMALDDDRFDTAKCHHHQESKSGSFTGREFVEPRLGFLSNGARSEWVAPTSMVEPIKVLMARNVDDFTADVFCRS